MGKRHSVAANGLGLGLEAVSPRVALDVWAVDAGQAAPEPSGLDRMIAKLDLDQLPCRSRLQLQPAIVRTAESKKLRQLTAFNQQFGHNRLIGGASLSGIRTKPAFMEHHGMNSLLINPARGTVELLDKLIAD